MRQQIIHFSLLTLALIPLLCSAQATVATQSLADVPQQTVTTPTLPPAPADEQPLITQLLQIGYLSYDSALHAMPDYAIIQARQEKLRQAYEAELKRVEDEFNRKYEDFLDGQRDFPRTILLKRQTELQQMLQHNLEFKRQGLQELKNSEEEALAPLRRKLSEAIAMVARGKGLPLVVNTDSNACPFIDSEMGVDLQEAVEQIVNSL